MRFLENNFSNKFISFLTCKDSELTIEQLYHFSICLDPIDTFNLILVLTSTSYHVALWLIMIDLFHSISLNREKNYDRISKCAVTSSSATAYNVIT